MKLLKKTGVTVVGLIFSGFVVFTQSSLGVEKVGAKTDIGVRVDCLNSFNLDKGSSQSCMSVTGLRAAIGDSLTQSVSARLVVDPFGTPVYHLKRTPFRDSIPLNADSRFGIIDDYEIRWEPKPNLIVKLEDYSGSVDLPSASGLSLASQLSTLGWDQSAISVTFNNLQFLKGTKVKFAVGNGEGERFDNSDPQQFIGFGITSYFLEGVGVQFGLSVDGNSAGSEEYDWVISRYQSDCGLNITPAPDRQGYSTQRIAGALFMDGTFPAARGLKMAVGWQRNVSSDLDKKTSIYPVRSDLDDCPRLDPDWVFVEDPDNESVNTMQRVTLNLSASYRILDKYFLGVDFERRRLDSGNVKLFQECEGYQGTSCPVTLRGDRMNDLTETAYTLGGGLDFDAGFNLTIEYYSRSFDRNYTNFFFPGRKGRATDNLELFNARLAYNFE